MNRRKFIKKTLEGIVIAGSIGSIPLISGCKKNPVESEPESILNSNSIIKDSIKYYMQTDKKIYSLGEEVEMLYRVTNLSDEDVTFRFPHSPQFNFWIEKDGEVIWRAINGWWPVITEFTLSPNNSKEFSYVWGGEVGRYSAIGGLYAGSGPYDHTKVSVPVEIIQ